MKYFLILLLLVTISCTHNKEKIDKKSNFKSKKIVKLDYNNIKKDPKIELYLSKYREQLQKKTEQIIGKLEIDLLKKGRDGGTLGRFSAEIIRDRASKYIGESVDFSVLNRGGLRVELFKGNIKVKNVYELMPFDNYIVIISLKGEYVKQLCKEIVKKHGIPVSQLQISHNKKSNITDCKVKGEEIKLDKNYKIATINYFYNVAKGVPSLKKGKVVANLYQKLFRDAIIEYIKEVKVISSVPPKQIFFN